MWNSAGSDVGGLQVLGHLYLVTAALVLSWPGVVEVFQMPESVLQRLQPEGSTKGVHLLEEDRKSAQGELEGGSANVTDPCLTETYLHEAMLVVAAEV